MHRPPCAWAGESADGTCVGEKQNACMNNQDDPAQRRDERGEEAGHHQEVAGVDGRGDGHCPRCQENKSCGDASKDGQVCVGKGKDVCADDRHSQNKLDYPKHFCHPGSPLLPPITIILGSLHASPDDHCAQLTWKKKKLLFTVDIFGLFKLKLGQYVCIFCHIECHARTVYCIFHRVLLSSQVA